MDVEIDHYRVLGLPSGEEGARLSEKAILKAYKRKALVLHPDKRPLDDPKAAHTDFQRLKLSYDVLKDDEQRKQFDHHLSVAKRIAKRRKTTVSDRQEREQADAIEREGREWAAALVRKERELAAAARAREERERAAAEAREARKRAEREEERRFARKLQEEVEMFKLQGVHEMDLEEETARMKINALRANKRTSEASSSSSFDSYPWKKEGAAYMKKETVAFGVLNMDDDQWYASMYSEFRRFCATPKGLFYAFDVSKALAEFQKLQSSYDILKDEKKRKQFDDRLRVERGRCHLQHDAAAKMPKMADLELERKRAASIFDPEILAKAREMELLDMMAEFAEFEGKRIQEKFYWRG